MPGWIGSAPLMACFQALQVELRDQVVADHAVAQGIGEVGGETGGGAVATQRLQPGRRRIDEGLGGHQVARHAAVERGQHTADQAHVVVQRQPVDHGAVLVEGVGLAHQFDVGDQVALTHLDAFWRAGRARGVLQEGHR